MWTIRTKVVVKYFYKCSLNRLGTLKNHFSITFCLQPFKNTVLRVIPALLLSNFYTYLLITSYGNLWDK